jgi:hypothetical protein
MPVQGVELKWSLTYSVSRNSLKRTIYKDKCTEFHPGAKRPISMPLAQALYRFNCTSRTPSYLEHRIIICKIVSIMNSNQLSMSFRLYFFPKIIPSDDIDFGAATIEAFCIKPKLPFGKSQLLKRLYIIFTLLYKIKRFAQGQWLAKSGAADDLD